MVFVTLKTTQKPQVFHIRIGRYLVHPILVLFQICAKLIYKISYALFRYTSWIFFFFWMLLGVQEILCHSSAHIYPIRKLYILQAIQSSLNIKSDDLLTTTKCPSYRNYWIELEPNYSLLTLNLTNNPDLVSEPISGNNLRTQDGHLYTLIKLLKQLGMQVIGR